MSAHRTEGETMKTEDFTVITLKDFLDAGDHPGIGKAQIIQQAVAQFEKDEDFLIIIRENHYRIQKGSVMSYINFLKEPLPEAPKEVADPIPPPTQIKKEEIVAANTPMGSPSVSKPAQRARKKK